MANEAVSFSQLGSDRSGGPPTHGGSAGYVMCEEVGSDRIFETSKSGEFSGFGWGMILFLWENEKKSGAQQIGRAAPDFDFF